MNLASSLEFFLRLCSLKPLKFLELKHHLVTAVSVKSRPGVLQMNLKHIKSLLKVGLQVEAAFQVSEGFSLPVNAKSSVGSVLATYCDGFYAVNMTMVESGSQKILIDTAF